ncbi:hypothetical protein [Arthrobacter sp. RIT-PI-e]|uniref:hypothetical protein n=1 Tax=Arthrobacter sp. RIT-PI-e TaxID=1681197 RepID=UPI00128E95F4|nr:hypothetical protein [Arthrobacter sp. RIT-PI-e]
MDEERRSGGFKVTDRVVYTHRDPKRRDRVLGTIVDQAFGRDSRHLPIWRFGVVADGETTKWPADPEDLQLASPQLIEEITQAPAQLPSKEAAAPATDIPLDPDAFDEEPPESGTPDYAVEMREYRKRLRRHEILKKRDEQK